MDCSGFPLRSILYYALLFDSCLRGHESANFARRICLHISCRVTVGVQREARRVVPECGTDTSRGFLCRADTHRRQSRLLTTQADRYHSAEENNFSRVLDVVFSFSHSTSNKNSENISCVSEISLLDLLADGVCVFRNAARR